MLLEQTEVDRIVACGAYVKCNVWSDSATRSFGPKWLKRSFLWLHGDRLKKSCFLKFGEVVVVANFLFCQKYAQNNRSILAHIFLLTSASMCGTVLCP